MKPKIEIDLMKIRQAKIENGNIVIPLEVNEIRTFKNKDGVIGASITFFTNQRKEVGAHQETHVIKQSLNVYERNALTAGHEVNLPIIGNLIDLDLRKNDYKAF